MKITGGAIKLHPFNLKTMYEEDYEIEDNGIIKIPTSCCALCQLSMNNSHTLKEIEAEIKRLEKEAYIKEWKPNDGKYYGQRACFVIVSPGEDILEKNLIKLKFKHVHNFNRRHGYPQIGELKMYILNW